nr:PREDICTED: N(G),N(G)-dimethylarginine dimethylaminohydrolase 2-like [Lepisosteus oculatus]
MAGVSPYGRFTHAVVRGIPESFGQEGGAAPAAVDLAKAQRQLGVLTGALRQKVGLQVLEVPADPRLPESWRLEDLAVVQGDTALVTRPFRQQRRGEAEAVRQVLSELKLRVVEVTDEGATLDGSDVLFTGREFFVGISSHTNHKGAEAVADTFRVSGLSLLVLTPPPPPPPSSQAFQKLTDCTLLPTACSEAAKLGGGLSSFCLLINRKPEL